MDLVAAVALFLRLEHVRHIVLDGVEVQGTRVGHDAGLALRAAVQDLIDGSIDVFSEDVPQAYVRRRRVPVGPGAAAARRESGSLDRGAAEGRPHARSVVATAEGGIRHSGAAQRTRIEAGLSLHAAGGGEGGQEIDHALPDQGFFRPLEKAFRPVAIADGVVALDPAVGDHRDEFAGLGAVELVDVLQVGDVDLHLLDDEIGEVAAPDAGALRRQQAGIEQRRRARGAAEHRGGQKPAAREITPADDDIHGDSGRAKDRMFGPEAIATN